MLKLEHKLKYAIDLGLDFLLRNTDENGTIAGEMDLHRHCLATFCVAENPRNRLEKVQATLAKISQHSYRRKDQLFIMNDEGETEASTNIIAALAFLSVEKVDWGRKYAQTILDRQLQDGFIVDRDSVETNKEKVGQAVKLFTRLYELTRENPWLERAKLSRDWILRNSNGESYWDVIGITYLAQHSITESGKVFVKKMMQNNVDDLNVHAHSGTMRGKDWEERTKRLCYAKIAKQTEPSNPWQGGAFLEENKPRIDWSQENISAFKQVLILINQYKKTEEV